MTEMNKETEMPIEATVVDEPIAEAGTTAPTFLKGLSLKPDDIKEFEGTSSKGEKYKYCLVPIGDTKQKLRISKSKEEILKKYTYMGKDGKEFTSYPLVKDKEYVVTPTHNVIGKDGKPMPWPKLTGEQIRMKADFIRIPTAGCKVKSLISADGKPYIGVSRGALSITIPTGVLVTTGFDGSPLPEDKQYLLAPRYGTPSSIVKYNKKTRAYEKEKIDFKNPAPEHTYGAMKKDFEHIAKYYDNKMNASKISDGVVAETPEAPVAKAPTEPSRD